MAQYVFTMNRVGKIVPPKRQILKDISLSFFPGAKIGVLGLNGAGKSTLLKIMAGVDKDIEGEAIPMPGINIGYLPQEPALDPAKTVRETVEEGMGEVMQAQEKLNAVYDAYADPDADFDALAAEQARLEAIIAAAGTNVETQMEIAADALRLPPWDAVIGNLSGGEKRRVALCRLLLQQPDVLLLDEPLAALDLKLRKDMQQELKNIQKATGITFVFVTHDQEEALSMSDTIVVMSEGRIQQIGTPIDIYNEPENAFVADFIGESNIVDGIMRKDFSVTFSGHTFTCVDKGFAKNENVDVVIRPEDVDIVPIEQGMLRGTVTSITFMGVHYEIIIDINGFKWMIQTTDYVDEGAEVGLYIEPDDIHIMKKSEYSGMYGDYSSFSNELDELSDAESEPDE